MSALPWLVLGCGVLAAAFALLGGLALRGRHVTRLAATWTVALLFAVSAALFATLGVATWGYRAFTREEVVAVVDVRPTGERAFDAAFSFPDGRQPARFRLAGDELYVDAHILKWQPAGNLLGLHTLYELDRVAGRYVDMGDERRLPRTVFSLAESKPLDLFNLRRDFPRLGLLVDAEYGSATFIMANEPARFEVRVSTTGLLIRRLGS